MTNSLSPNTQAILLLTAPLIVGRGTRSEAPLSAADYARLAVHLHASRLQPADFLASDADAAIRASVPIVEEARLRRLLERGFLLSQAVERWNSRAIWVLSRADAAYPRRIKSRLNGAAPPIFYGCGDMSILETGGLGIVGSRDVDQTLVAYTERTAELAATAQQTVISGGARGIDQAAMRGALQAGGRVVGVLADGLEKAAMNRANRDPLMQDQLVLVSPYDPSAGFNVGHAMQRNKLIYALADAALVVNSDVNKGGTWAGAIEQLEKFRFVRVYVRSTGEVNKGLAALKQRGAIPWPNPTDASGLVATLRSVPDSKPAASQGELPLVRGVAEAPSDSYAPQRQPSVREEGPAAELFEKVREILVRALDTPKSAKEIGIELGVAASQARDWLHRLAKDQTIERCGKKEVYVARSNQVRTQGGSEYDRVPRTTPETGA